jgi:hypothetical protein
LKLEQALELASKHVHGCILCGSGQVFYIGCFLPAPEQLYPTSKYQVAFYGVCGECLKDHNAQQHIEAKLLELRPRK